MSVILSVTNDIDPQHEADYHQQVKILADWLHAADKDENINASMKHVASYEVECQQDFRNGSRSPISENNKRFVHHFSFPSYEDYENLRKEQTPEPVRAALLAISGRNLQGDKDEGAFIKQTQWHWMTEKSAVRYSA